MNFSPTRPLPTLAEVRCVFEQWREQRTRMNEKIPERLKAEVVLLKGRYRRADIMRQLRLSGHQVERMLQQAPAVFMAVPLPVVYPLELYHPSGMKLCVTVSEGQLPAFMQTFMTCCK